MLVAALVTAAGFLLCLFLAVETNGIPLGEASGENQAQLQRAPETARGMPLRFKRSG
jgi:hypothetical protein